MSTSALSDAITSGLQSWNQGQQQAALDILRPHADADEREALLLLSWFMAQMGQPFWNDGLVFARRANELGIPQALTYYFPHLFNDPSYRAQTPAIAHEIVTGGWSLDPLPNASSAMQQNDPGTAVGLVRAAAAPRPSESALLAIARQAESDFATLRDAAGDVADRRDAAYVSIDSDRTAVADRRSQIEQRAQSLIDLIDQITNAQATSYFDQEATTYETEAKILWRFGFGVIVTAALLAVTPLTIYYIDRILGHKPWIHGHDVAVAHTTATIALGTVAGILLARARGRDRARQRNRELTVALQTMFVYAEQFEDPDERQAFIRDMGRTVIEAFLRQEPATDADRGLLAALRTH